MVCASRVRLVSLSLGLWCQLVQRVVKVLFVRKVKEVGGHVQLANVLCITKVLWLHFATFITAKYGSTTRPEPSYSESSHP